MAVNFTELIYHIEITDTMQEHHYHYLLTELIQELVRVHQLKQMQLCIYYQMLKKSLLKT